MKPKVFRIQRNEGCEAPAHYVFLDASCRQGVNNDGAINKNSPFKLDYAYVQRCSYRRGRFGGWRDGIHNSGADLWGWIREQGTPRQPTWVFAYNWHFLAQVTGLWQEFDSERFKLGLPERERINEEGEIVKVKEWKGFLAIDEKPFVIYAVGTGGTVKIVDVRNYYDLPIAQIIQSFGNRNAAILQATDTEAERRDKIHSRVEAIGAAITQTVAAWKDGDRGNWQPTAARLAWSNYRHEFMPEQMRLMDNNKMDRTFQRSGFFGGEFAHWYRGRYDGRVYKIDVNSLFPSVMATGNFPVGVKFIAEAGTPLASTCPANPAHCMAEVLVYGVGDLPTRLADGRVDYPCGVFSAVLCGSELDYAVRHNRIRAWHRWTSFDCAPIFDRFVAYWWAQRVQAKATRNDAQAMLAKLIMNSLYGRFAQRSPKWKLDTTNEAPIRWGNFLVMNSETRKFEKQRSIAGVRQRLVGQEEKDDTFPAVSAFVTSAARLYMRCIRSIAGSKSVLLQQADSLTLTEPGYDLVSRSVYFGDGLGQCRLEACAEWIDVWGPNHYQTNHGWVLAGCPGLREKSNHDNRWKTRRSFSTADVIGEGLSDGARIKESTYIVRPGRTCREFGHDGWAFV